MKAQLNGLNALTIVWLVIFISVSSRSRDNSMWGAIWSLDYGWNRAIILLLAPVVKRKVWLVSVFVGRHPSFRSVSSKAILRSMFPFASRTRISPERKFA